jgi:Transposase DDE domain
VLFEQNAARITDFRRGEALDRRDHLVRWPKPERPPQWMTKEQYETFPDELTVREVKVDGQILAMTMLDHRKVRKSALSALYGLRWNAELDLRNIKTTLGMELLRCKTPEMNEKEMWVHLLAYNLIRLLMAQTALNASVHPRRLSFKHTVQIWTDWTSQRLSSNPARHNTLMFQLIAQLKVVP